MKILSRKRLCSQILFAMFQLSGTTINLAFSYGRYNINKDNKNNNN